MKRYFVCIVMFVLCVSCEYQFDVESSDEAPKLFIESIAGFEDELTYMKVMKTTPIGNPRQSGEEYELQWKNLTFDGKEVPMYKVEGQPFYYYPELDDKTSEIFLKMKAEGMKDISAYTIVPPKPEVSVKYDLLSDRILWKLNISGSSYYAIALYLKTEGDGGTPESRWEEVSVYNNLDGMSLLEMLSSSFKKIEWRTYFSSFPLTLFRREEMEGGVLSIASDKMEGEYKVEVYSLSESAYGYLNAIYNQSNNYLGMLGLSPPNFAYSNIEGGYGVLGAVRKTEKLISVESNP